MQNSETNTVYAYPKQYLPIIYVRGYAGTQGQIEDTAATPYMGFNLGSTKYRQDNSRNVHKWVFESPLIRLMKDHGYVDAYRDGKILPEGPIPYRSIWIFRYYDISSNEMTNEASRKEIEFHAEELRKFILKVRERVEQPPGHAKFQVILIAHSMGGLVCRCYLQNPDILDLDHRKPGDTERKGVAKLFTYATPHGGINFRAGLGWVEGFRDFLDPNNAGNFGPKRMKEFLALEDDKLNSLNGQFPPEKTFCLIGTDSRDYSTLGGLARRAVGPISDGLVQIENAYIDKAPRAFVHRSHSGHYGIVNSEEGYQNLERFLFGDTRVMLRLKATNLRLPKKKNISASYYVETEISIRGIPVKIHRRTMDTASATMRTMNDMLASPTHLHTLFLSKRKIVKRYEHEEDKAMAFLVHVRIVPQYQIDKKLWFDEYFEGKAIFDESLEFEVKSKPDGTFEVTHRWNWQGDTTPIPLEWLPSTNIHEDCKEARIVFSRSYIEGELLIKVSEWK